MDNLYLQWAAKVKNHFQVYIPDSQQESGYVTQVVQPPNSLLSLQIIFHSKLK